MFFVPKHIVMTIIYSAYVFYNVIICYIPSTAALCIRWRNTNIIYYLWLLNTQNILVLNLRKSFFWSHPFDVCVCSSHPNVVVYNIRHLDEVCHLMPSTKVEQEIQHWVFWLLPVIHFQATIRVFRAAPKWWINK